MDLLRLQSFQSISINENTHDYAIKIETSNKDSECPKCDSVEIVKNGSKKNQSFWDIPISGKRVCLVIDRQKYKCKACGNTWLEALADIDDNRKMTIRLIDYIEEQSLYKNRTFTSLADEIGITDHTVRNVFFETINRYEKEFVPKTPKWLGIDEIHLIGVPRAVITNVAENTVLEIKKDRKQATIIEYLRGLPSKEQIEVVTMDMWNPYRTAVKTVLPNAKIVVDKFHVVRMANQALEEVRKNLRKTLTSTQRKVLKNERFILLKRKKALSVKETILMESWTKSFPILGTAYELKEAFYQIWDIEDRAVANEVLHAWNKSIPYEMKTTFAPLVTAIGNWEEEIFNYYDYKATNAYTESLNSIIRHVDRIGRGYSFEVLRAKILYSRGIRKVHKPPYEDGLKSFGSIVAESSLQYGQKDLGADLSLILQKLKEGVL